MSEPPGPPPDTFPDVRVRPQIALVLITGLTVVYGLAFITLGAAQKGEGAAIYASFCLGAGLLVLSYIDLRTGLLPDLITLPLIVAGVGYAALIDDAWGLALAGAFVGSGLIAGLGYIWRYARGYDGIGLGDAKLLAAGGAWAGLTMLPVILLIASGIGLLGAVFVAQKAQTAEQRVAIPFGPSLSLGIWVGWCTEGIVFG